jgi:hypothetical protein
VSRPSPHLVYLGISEIGYVRQRDFAMTELLSELSQLDHPACLGRENQISQEAKGR